MGDRTWANIKIGGHLEDVEEAEDLIAAMTDDGIADNEQDGKDQLREAVEKARYVYYEGDEVNYGVFAAVDAHVLSNAQLACATAFGNGGGYDSGSRTIHGGTRHDFEGRGGGLIPRKEVRELLASGGAEDVIKQLDAYDKLEFDPVEKLTASPAVTAWLKIFGNKAA